MVLGYFHQNQLPLQTPPFQIILHLALLQVCQTLRQRSILFTQQYKTPNGTTFVNLQGYNGTPGIINGNQVINGTLTLDGNQLINGSLTVTGTGNFNAITSTGNITAGGDIISSGAIMAQSFSGISMTFNTFSGGVIAGDVITGNTISGNTGSFQVISVGSGSFQLISADTALPISIYRVDHGEFRSFSGTFYT